MNTAEEPPPGTIFTLFNQIRPMPTRHPARPVAPVPPARIAPDDRRFLPPELTTLRRLPALRLDHVLAKAALPPDHPVYLARNAPDRGGRIYTLCDLHKIGPTGAQVVVMLPDNIPVSVSAHYVYVPLGRPRDEGWGLGPARPANSGTWTPETAPAGARGKD